MKGLFIIIVSLLPDRTQSSYHFTPTKYFLTLAQKKNLSNSHSLENSPEAALAPEQI